ENDGLGRGRHLHRPERYAFGDHFAGGVERNGRTFQADTHAIGLFAYAKCALAKCLPRGVREPVTLRAAGNTDDFARLQAFEHFRRKRSFWKQGTSCAEFESIAFAQSAAFEAAEAA